ncbi:hypothetical protein S101258_02734 [Lactiplantibacillus plantarum subsp. plantarum]|uniref:Uncharacterized protein n=1 Tax=Lactiplantibacillus plantarum subsp. plantarum TaxID=337330 RepID=A0A2S3U2Q8_LACPN|nr:hypothetical protein S101258_02734 [Lactiplantibacillus plantarum subsp. plantarum]
MMQSITTFMAALGKYDFLKSALITAIMVGVMSGIIGSFIIFTGHVDDGRCHLACRFTWCCGSLYARYQRPNWCFGFWNSSR